MKRESALVETTPLDLLQALDDRIGNPLAGDFTRGVQKIGREICGDTAGCHHDDDNQRMNNGQYEFRLANELRDPARGG
jgi:hypothetical protein